MFKEIHDIIVEDNKRNGTRPSIFGPTPSSYVYPQGSTALPPSPRPLSMPEKPHLYDMERGSRNGINQRHHGHSRETSPARPSSQQTRERPPIRAKPDRLHAIPSPRSVNGNGVQSPAEVIAERFAQLRMPQGPSRAPLPYPDDDHALDLLTPGDYYSLSKSSSHISAAQNVSSKPNRDPRPSGPRAMPPSGVPPLPPKVPLNAQLDTSLPRAPSPTYSPARNSQGPSGVTPLRDTGRMNSYGTAAPVSVDDSFSYITPYTTTKDDEMHLPTPTNHSRLITPAKAKFQELPNCSAISAKELYDRMRHSDILLIDVRSRQDYDDGHILAKSIMCLEPSILKIGISAEDLEDRLVLSPESEEELFKRRDEFDLVVYYDQETPSNYFLEGPPNTSRAPALRALHESLWDFNYSKKLERPPAVLLGGLAAWIDLVGSHALQTSRTNAQLGIARARRPANGVGVRNRASTVTYNSSREVHRRRLREYTPLDADEERVWLEKAKQEEVETADYQVQDDGDTDSVSSRTDEPPSPLIHSYEDFLRRFPEPQSIQQSMVGVRQGPPSRPAPIIPAIPSRPPPAVPRLSYKGESERESNQLSTNSRHPPSVQPPLYTSRTITQYLKLPRTGLINFSVTCYMNATIQCLLATVPLSQFFLDNRWRDFTQKNWKGSNGIMPEIYANLIRSLWKNDVQAVRPTSLRNFCTRLNREWGIDRQQDAKEFLEFIIDCLHEDLNTNWNRRPLRPLTTEEELMRERMPVAQVSKVEWQRYSHRESSFISDLFAGQHASRLRCTTCGSTSTTYEAFYSISVEIPRSGRGDIRDCLRSYCQEEMLSGDEVWKCPNCKCEREATKRITLTRLPKVLVIHFKRFSASKTESAKKLHTPIDFPLHGLKMEPYMANTQENAATIAENGGYPDPAITPPFQYDAYAVMRHLGQTGNGGHYISLVRDAARGCWRKFDDERAQDFDPNKLRPEQRLQNEQAYIVFYGRSAAR